MDKLYTNSKHVNEVESADRPLWMRDLVLYSIIVLLSAMDGINLYITFDSLMEENPFLNFALTIGVALVLNFIPLLLARLLHMRRYHDPKAQNWMIPALCAVFMVVFIATFILRWVTRDALVSNGLDNMSVTVGTVTGSADPSASGKTTALALLLGVLPFVTSAINLALGYLNDDPVERKLRNLKITKAQLENEISIDEAALYELSIDWDKALGEIDEKNLEAAKNESHSVREYIKKLSRAYLARKMKNPDDISRLTQ